MSRHGTPEPDPATTLRKNIKRLVGEKPQKALAHALRVDPGLLNRWLSEDPVHRRSPSRRNLIMLGRLDADRSQRRGPDAEAVINEWLQLGAQASVTDEELADAGFPSRRRFVEEVLRHRLVFASLVFKKDQADLMEIVRNPRARGQFAKAVLESDVRVIVLTVFESKLIENEIQRTGLVQRYLPGAFLGYLLAIQHIITEAVGTRARAGKVQGDLVNTFRDRLRFGTIRLPGEFPEDFFGFCRPRYRLLFGLDVKGDAKELLDGWPHEKLSLKVEGASAVEQHDDLRTNTNRAAMDVMGVVDDLQELTRMREWLGTLKPRLTTYRLARSIKDLTSLASSINDVAGVPLEEVKS